MFALFTPGETIRRFVLSALESARRIRVMAFILTDPPILSALRRRHDAGVDVAGVYDPHGVAAVLRQVRRNPLQFWFLVDDRFVAAPSHPFDPAGEQDFLHNRLIVLDNTVITGSANFAADAIDNAENALVMRSPSLAATYAEYVETVAAAYRDQTSEAHNRTGAR
jgi:phosphatidylserine/phosphatidylglycerophosphate/cardiolipin synthase-like enzyme